MQASSRSLDRVEVTFDDDRAVASAGLILPMALAQNLGLGDLVDELVDLGDAPGRANVGLKTLGLVASVLAGGDCIDDADALRSGATDEVIAQWMPAPSTLGTYLRSFSFGHARQLDAVSRELLARAYGAGAGPGPGEAVTVDVDSTICETYGLAKQGGSRFGYTHVRGYHPLVAVMAGRGDVIHARLRSGPANSGRGAASFLTETFSRLRHAGVDGPITLRADSGFYSRAVVEAAAAAGVAFSITVRMQKALKAAIDDIAESDWVGIPYFLEGAAVAETTYRAFSHSRGRDVRLIVRRVPPTPGSQLALFQTHTYHAFITDRDGDMLFLEADHRAHAEVENAIRDLKYGVGLNHMPSGRFGANAAWMAHNIVAYNLARWTMRIGLGPGIITTKAFRRRFIDIPAHLTWRSRNRQLHLARHWPWQREFMDALAAIRAIPLLRV